VDDLLRLELGLGDDDLRLLLRRVAEVLRDALGGDQGLLQGALALEVALQLHLGALELILERDVLLHHVLELRRQELQEPLHVASGVAAEGGLEALLADVERGELHGRPSLAEPRRTPRNRLHGRRKGPAPTQHRCRTFRLLRARAGLSAAGAGCAAPAAARPSPEWSASSPGGRSPGTTPRRPRPPRPRCGRAAGAAGAASRRGWGRARGFASPGCFHHPGAVSATPQNCQPAMTNSRQSGSSGKIPKSAVAVSFSPAGR